MKKEITKDFVNWAGKRGLLIGKRRKTVFLWPGRDKISPSRDKISPFQGQRNREINAFKEQQKINKS